MIDHMGLVVRDFARSKAFYRAALAPAGLILRAEYPASVTGNVDVAGFGEPPQPETARSPEFWLSQGEPGAKGLHVCFAVTTRAQVDAFYQAACAAGGRDNGAPGLRPHYHADYYAAFVLDLDGNNIEVVCRQPGQAA